MNVIETPSYPRRAGGYRRIPNARWSRILICLLVAPVFSPRLAAAQDSLLIANLQTNTISRYDAATGATVQTPFITAPGNGFHSLEVDGNNHLFVSTSTNNLNTIGEYNAATGAAINNSFINSQGVTFRGPIALDANNHLFVECGGIPGSWVAEYDAITGAMINANFVSLNQGLQVGGAMAIDKVNNHMFVVDYHDVREFDAVTGATINYYFARADTPGAMVVDGFNHLFVAAGMGATSGVIEYNALTGAVINSHFITGITYPQGLALDGNNHLFVTRNDGNSTIGEYDATTGATINADFINGQGLDQPGSIVFVSSVPEPSTMAAPILGVMALMGRQRSRKAGLSHSRVMQT